MPARVLEYVIDGNVSAALQEDVGSGDLTALLVPADDTARASVVVREAAVLAGAPWFDAVFRRLSPAVQVTWHKHGRRDGRGRCNALPHGRAGPQLCSPVSAPP